MWTLTRLPDEFEQLGCTGLAPSFMQPSASGVLRGSLRVNTASNGTIAATVVAEAVTVHLRFDPIRTATEFITTEPRLHQFHRMFWGVPLLLVVPGVCPQATDGNPVEH